MSQIQIQPLTKESILAALAANAEHYRHDYRVRRIGLFGSFVRGEQTDESDIDILVDFECTSFDGYFDLKFELEDMFSRSVDLVLAHTLKKYLKPIIEVETLYAA